MGRLYVQHSKPRCPLAAARGLHGGIDLRQDRASAKNSFACEFLRCREASFPFGVRSACCSSMLATSLGSCAPACREGCSSSDQLPWTLSAASKAQIERVWEASKVALDMVLVCPSNVQG